MAAALEALRSEIDVPYRLILNSSNLGSSIARNQIIDDMLACGAAYFLFTDGDIEIVPFSSFAMLRYMENNGRGWAGSAPIRTVKRPSAIAPRPSCTPSTRRFGTTNLNAWTQYDLFRREVFGPAYASNTPNPSIGLAGVSRTTIWPFRWI